jgi:hypothetical protein
MRFRLYLIPLIIAVLTFTGCATKAGLPPILPPGLGTNDAGTVAIVPAGYMPEPTFTTFAKGRWTGAGKGAAGGAAIGTLEGVRAAAAGGPIGVLLLPFFAAGGAVLGGTIGSISGAISAIPADKAREIEVAISTVLAESNGPETLAGVLLSQGRLLKSYRFHMPEGQGPLSPEERPEYSNLADEGSGTVLEVPISRAGFDGGEGGDPSVAFVTEVSVRLLRLSDGAELYRGGFVYRSGERKFAFWAKDNGALLRSEIASSYQELAERIVEHLFLVIDFPISHWSTDLYCMLRPLAPEQGYGFFKTTGKFVPVDSFQPTLKWEAFPRDMDRDGAGKDLVNRIDGVTYDLKVWKAEREGFRGPMAYARSRLPGTEHRIEYPLEPETKYFWTVRAIFDLDGHEQATKWSLLRRPHTPALDPCTLDTVPDSHAYRFVTP